MNAMKKITALFLALVLTVLALAACDGSVTTGDPAAGTSTGGAQSTAPGTSGTAPEESSSTPATTDKGEEPVTPAVVDYVAELKLDMKSSTVKEEVTVKTFVDGDTTHFNVSKTTMAGGVLKARYLAINTPESTGKIEQYGKKASNFTKEKLKNAARILVESDNETWNADSTGSRYLCWVWYKTDSEGEWRNLNLEILQNGLAIASNTAGNRYGETCVKALNQAKSLKLNVFSGVKDPDFPDGDAKELTLKELRANIQDYNNTNVAFEGVITKNYSNTVYVEEYDEETDMYYGMTVYYGFNLSGGGMAILNVGNRVRIVGTVQYYEAGGTYQVSGLQYREMKPNDPANIQLISKGHDPAYTLTDAKQFAGGKVTIAFEEENREFSYASLAMSTSISMSDLKVKKIYTTKNEESSSKGAMTITCEKDGVEIVIRTVVLYDDDRNLVTQDAYEGKTLSVRGIVDYYDGSYQIKVYSVKDITVQ